MKRHSVIKFQTICFLLLLFSCDNNKKNTEQWTKKEMLEFTDSIEIHNLIAGYSDGEGHTVLIKNPCINKGVLKVTCNDGFPDIIDSLRQIDTRTFESLKNPARYLVNDTEVVVTVFKKVIHPSSNWQGQTPWQETIVSSFRRRDLGLK